MLRWKDAPYVFTLLVGIIGFLANQIISKLSEAPVVEYSFELRKDQNGVGRGMLTVKNVSEKCKFDSIVIVLEHSTVETCGAYFRTSSYIRL